MGDAIVSIFDQGGWVTYALALVSATLWASVWGRMRALRRGFSGELKPYVQHCLSVGVPPNSHGAIPRFVGEAISLRASGDPARLAHLAKSALDELAFMRSALRTLVAVAPLLGLLGTVAGMVEMFGSLHGGTGGSARESTVAGGIATALITTQLGLVIGAPGLVAARLLSRREVRLGSEIRETVSLLTRSGGEA